MYSNIKERENYEINVLMKHAQCITFAIYNLTLGEQVREHAAAVLAGLMKGGDEDLARDFRERAYAEANLILKKRRNRYFSTSIISLQQSYDCQDIRPINDRQAYIIISSMDKSKHVYNISQEQFLL